MRAQARAGRGARCVRAGREGGTVGLDGKNGTDVRETLLSFLDALYGYGIALTRNATETEDLVQDTYMQATLHCEGLRQDSNIKAWMFTIMRNRWLKQLRREASGPEFVALDDAAAERWLLDSDMEPGRLCERLWEREEIRAALRELPVSQREIILLRDIEGFSYKEMADLLDCPVGTIMSRLSRARARFKKLLLHRWSEYGAETMAGRT